MTTRPANLPRWATDAGRTLEPTSGEKDTGWQAGYRPPARKMNWTVNHLCTWINYVWEQFARLITANWFSATTLPTSNMLRGVAYSPSLDRFCAVGDDDAADADIVTSTDGLTWAEQANAKAIDLNDVAWSPSLALFCAVGDADGTDAYVLTSANGTAWTERANPKNFGLNAIAWSPSLALFAAVGEDDGVDMYIVTSPDGINWTERSNGAGARLRDIVWNPDLALFCAVGQAGSILTSTDGITWTSRTPASGSGSAQFTAVGNVGSRLIIASDAGDYFQWSENGTIWADVGSVPFTPFDIYAFAYSEELDVCIGAGAGYVIESADAEEWIVVAVPGDISIRGTEWSSELGKFLLVGDNGASSASKIYASLAWPGLGL